jgi:hypothetical protein
VGLQLGQSAPNYREGPEPGRRSACADVPSTKAPAR